MTAVVVSTVLGNVVIVGVAVWVQWLNRRDVRRLIAESRALRRKP